MISLNCNFWLKLKSLIKFIRDFGYEDKVKWPKVKILVRREETENTTMYKICVIYL